jgi:microcystin degradation protein MlrC
MSRVALVSVWQETNTYSSRPTTIAEFEAFELLEGDAIVERHRGTGTVLGGFLDGLAADEPVGVIAIGAWPGGAPDEATAQALLARLDDALARAPEVDGVLVNLHGAMVCSGVEDMEQETLRRIAARWPTAPRSVVLDLHGNPSPGMVELCDALVGYQTYPHVDMRECGEEAAALLRRALDGTRLTTVLGKLAHLTSPVDQGSADEPMRGLLERARERAGAAGALRISLLPGFPYSDVARTGFSVTVTIDAEHERTGRRVAAETLDDVEVHLGDFGTPRDDAAAAVRRALASDATPVILADLADNVGGGGPGDGTAILAELVAQSADGAIVTVVDPAAVDAAAAAGPGATIDVALGGHSDDLHGDPVRLSAVVERLGDGRYVSGGSYMTGQRFEMGPTAVLRVGGVQVLAMSRATPPFHLEQLTSVGLEPADATVIAVKGAVAWRDPYAAVTGSSIEVDTPGCCPADPYRLPRRTAPQAVDPLTPESR